MPYYIDGPLTPQSVALSSSSSSSAASSSKSDSSTRPDSPLPSTSSRTLCDTFPPWRSHALMYPLTAHQTHLLGHCSPQDPECQETDWVEYSQIPQGFEDIQLDSEEDASQSTTLTAPGVLLDYPTLAGASMEVEPKTALVRSIQLAELAFSHFAPSQCVNPPSPIKLAHGPSCIQQQGDVVFSLPGERHTKSDISFSTHGSYQLTPSSTEDQSSREGERREPVKTCDSCDTEGPARSLTQILPCGHWACEACFAAILSAVSVNPGPSHCPCCLGLVNGLGAMRKLRPSQLDPRLGQCETDPAPSQPLPTQIVGAGPTNMPTPRPPQYMVLRIDNIAWDVTPALVERFLPPDVLPPEHPHPIHILLDLRDGKTRDYLYVEVRSAQAAKKVLQSKQNTLMPDGSGRGRTRPVTIVPVTHAELITELRPKDPAELYDLLRLCQAAVAVPSRPSPAVRHSSACVSNGLAHFVKSRHGPFHLLLSILSKLGGQQSPAYFDLLAVTSGALAALDGASRCFDARRFPANGATYRADEDRAVRNGLVFMLGHCFGVMVP